MNISSQKISKYKLGLKIAKYLKLNTKLILKNNFDYNKFTIRPKNMALSNNKIVKQFPSFKGILSLKSQINLAKLRGPVVYLLMREYC